MPASNDPLFYPNSFARVTLDAIRAATDEALLAAVLGRAGLTALLTAPPPDNASRQFSFDHYAALLDALEAELGARGAQAVKVQIGRALWEELLRDSGKAWGTQFFYEIPTPAERVGVLLQALAYTLRRYSDHHADVQTFSDHYTFIVTRCPFCHQHGSVAPSPQLANTPQPQCQITRELLRAALRYASASGALAWRSTGRDYVVEPVACMAAGDAQGRLLILK